MNATPWIVKEESEYFILTRTIGGETEIWTDDRSTERHHPYWKHRENAEAKAAELNLKAVAVTFPFGSVKAIPTHDLVNEPKSYVVEAHRHMKPVRKLYVLFWQKSYGSAQYRVVDAQDGIFQSVVWLTPGAYRMSDIADRVLLVVYGDDFKNGKVTGSCKMLGVES